MSNPNQSLRDELEDVLWIEYDNDGEGHISGIHIVEALILSKQKEARLEELNYAHKMVDAYGFMKHFDLRKAELSPDINNKEVS